MSRKAYEQIADGFRSGLPDALAVDVANRVLDHLRTMYPDALKAVPASAQVSLRNVAISAATNVILAAKAEEREAVLQFEFDLPATACHPSGPAYAAGWTDCMTAIREYIRKRGGE